VTNTRTRTTAATILVVAAVVAASSALALRSRSEADHSAAPPPTAASSEPHTESPNANRGQAQRAVVSQAPAQVVPERLGIPAIGVDAPLVPTGVTKTGNAEIPADGDVVGWYEYGAAPGAPMGSAVLIGHRDTNAEGAGALFDLDELSVGANVTITGGNRTLAFRVTAVRSVEKAALPSSLFRRDGQPRLVVITCGGAFLPDAGGYQENLFAVAVPAKR
jgi:LPXTG-site transpeptidase (sortase) family protein